MNHLLIGQIAGFLALVQVIPYIISILRGHTKPARTSYFIWLVVGVITTASYISVGAFDTIWTGLVHVITAFIIFLLSLKYGVGGSSRLDIFCLVLGISGAILWAYVNSAEVALYIMVFVGFIGYIPTLKKTYLFPRTENSLSWTLTAIAGIINLFALSSFELKIALPVVCAAILKSSVVFLLFLPRSKSKYSPRRAQAVSAA